MLKSWSGSSVCQQSSPSSVRPTFSSLLARWSFLQLTSNSRDSIIYEEGKKGRKISKCVNNNAN